MPVSKRVLLAVGVSQHDLILVKTSDDLPRCEEYAWKLAFFSPVQELGRFHFKHYRPAEQFCEVSTRWVLATICKLNGLYSRQPSCQRVSTICGGRSTLMRDVLQMQTQQRHRQ